MLSKCDSMTPMLCYFILMTENIKLCLLNRWIYVCMCVHCRRVLEWTENLMDDVIFTKASLFQFCFTISANRSKCIQYIKTALYIFISLNIDRIASDSFVESIVESFVYICIFFQFCLCPFHINWQKNL